MLTWRVVQRVDSNKSVQAVVNVRKSVIDCDAVARKEDVKTQKEMICLEPESHRRRRLRSWEPDLPLDLGVE